VGLRPDRFWWLRLDFGAVKIFFNSLNFQVDFLFLCEKSAIDHEPDSAPPKSCSCVAAGRDARNSHPLLPLPKVRLGFGDEPGVRPGLSAEPGRHRTVIVD
jgi:hypothetical protein